MPPNVKSIVHPAKTPRLMHPGAVLFHQYMQPNFVSIRTLTWGILGFERQEDARRFLGDFIPVDQNIAERLAAATGTTPEYWLELQRMYDAEK